MAPPSGAPSDAEPPPAGKASPVVALLSGAPSPAEPPLLGSASPVVALPCGASSPVLLPLPTGCATSAKLFLYHEGQSSFSFEPIASIASRCMADSLLVNGE